MANLGALPAHAPAKAASTPVLPGSCCLRAISSNSIIVGMSTQETIKRRAGPCPCGNGHVMTSITTQDNPWSSADIYHYLQCDACARNWRVDSGRLVSRAEESLYRQAREDHYAVMHKLSALTGPLVDAYFEQFAAPSMAAEHREMLRLDIATSNIRSFRKDKNAGRRPSELSFARRNMTWLRQLVHQAGLEAEFDALLQELEDADARQGEAYRNVRRISIPHLGIWGS